MTRPVGDEPAAAADVLPSGVELEVFEALHGQVEPDRESAEHEVGDAMKRVVRRQRQ